MRPPEEISKKGQQDNISQFAFTATPKPKTLELFGTKVDGQISAFDEYTMEEAIKEGIKPSIYTHPIGYYGHAAGTTIGMWDSQGGVPHTGDHPLHANTAYAIELNAATFIKEWNKEIRIMLEEDAFFDGKDVNYIHGRQTNFHLISGYNNNQLSD